MMPLKCLRYSLPSGGKVVFLRDPYTLLPEATYRHHWIFERLFLWGCIVAGVYWLYALVWNLL